MSSKESDASCVQGQGGWKTTTASLLPLCWSVLRTNGPTRTCRFFRTAVLHLEKKWKLPWGPSSMGPSQRRMLLLKGRQGSHPHQGGKTIFKQWWWPKARSITHVQHSLPLILSTIQTFTPFHQTWWLITMWLNRQKSTTLATTFRWPPGSLAC